MFQVGLAPRVEGTKWTTHTHAGAITNLRHQLTEDSELDKRHRIEGCQNGSFSHWVSGTSRSLSAGASRHTVKVEIKGGHKTYRRKEGLVVDLAPGAAAGVLPELFDDRAEDGLGRQEAGSPQGPLHSGLGDVSDVETVVVREEGRKA